MNVLEHANPFRAVYDWFTWPFQVTQSLQKMKEEEDKITAGGILLWLIVLIIIIILIILIATYVKRLYKRIKK